MNKSEIDYLAVKNYDRMAEYDQKQLAKTTKNIAIISTTVLGISGLACLIVSIYSFCIKNGSGASWLGIFAGIIVGLVMLLYKYDFLRLKTAEEWALHELADRIKQASKLRRKGKATLKHIRLLHASDIISVSLIDKFTEVTDKLHGFLNYQEIIQTRYYKFKIEFEENDFEIFQTKENSADCSYLLSLIK